MERRKIVFRPSGPPLSLPPVSADGLSVTLKEARAKLLSQDMHTVGMGAFELRQLLLREVDISAVIPLIPARLRLAMGGARERASDPPQVSASMPVPRSSAAKVHLSECLMLAAKNRLDISPALSVVQAAMADTDIHVRNNTILALGYHSMNGGDISLYISMIAPHLTDIIPMNREAAVWTLKQHAMKGKMEAHAVLLALGDEKNDDVCSSDVRACCLDTMRRG